MTHYKENVCPACGKDTSNLALEERLITWEECDTYLMECKWHKRCYRKVAGKAAMDGLLRAIAEEPEGELASIDDLVGQAVVSAVEMELDPDGFPTGASDPEMN